MEAMVLSGEPVSPPRAMLVTGLNELPPEVWPASDPAVVFVRPDKAVGDT